RVGAVVVAEAAVEAELVHRLEALGANSSGLGRARVDEVEELGEGRAERQAAPALVADLPPAVPLAVERPRARVGGVGGAEGAGRVLRRVDLHRGRAPPERLVIPRCAPFRPRAWAARRGPSGSARRATSRPSPASRTTRRSRRTC